MKIRLLLLLSLVALPALSADAKPYHLTSVRWIVANRNKITYDDHYVTMIGHVTRRMGDEEYWFTDGTGSIRLDSENFDLPVGPRLKIGGRIDEAYLGFGHIEVDVRKWSYAPAHHVHPAIAAAHRRPATTMTGTPMTAPAPAATPAAPPPPSPSVTAPAVTTPAPLAPPPISTAPPATPTMTTPETSAPAAAATAEAPATNAAPTLAPPTETTATNAVVPSTIPPDSTTSPPPTNATTPTLPPVDASASTNAAMSAPASTNAAP